MNLLDIMMRYDIKWPIAARYAAQDKSAVIYWYSSRPVIDGEEWNGYNTSICFGSQELALDWSTRIITLEEWQQERDKMQKQAVQQTQDNQWHERWEFPPAGCECEAFADGCEPEVCTILAIHNGTAAVKWSKFNNGGLDVITLNGLSFRPIRTDREKAIDEMAAALINRVSAMSQVILGELYDAGFRKEQTK